MKKHFLYYSLFAVSVLFTAQTLSAQTPGGAQSVNVVAWLTPENYNGAVWTNLATGAGAVGNFSQNGLLGSLTGAKPPVKVDRGYNFHQSLLFEKTSNTLAPNRLQSATAFSNANTENVTTIFVLKRKMGYSDGLLSLNNANYSNLEGDIHFHNANNGQVFYNWYTTDDRLNNAIYSANEGLITIDNANNTNTTTGGIDFYLNGGRLGSRVTSGGSAAYNNGSRIVIGGVYERYASQYGYNGDLQEVIVLKANGANQHLTDVDFRKIHSYLAIKYGFTLEGNPNYLNSAGTVIWQTDATYNKNIFGIGRDDNGGLYQKQSKSNNSDAITAFIGTISDLNHQNAAVFPMDKTHLIFGSNGVAGETAYNYPLNTQFANARNTQYILNSRANEIWKTRFTVDDVAATATQTINIKVNNSAVKYVLVCPDINFNAANTRIYEVNNYIADAVQINSGEYVALGKFVPTPGGVSGNFVAWLAPENYNGLVWANQATGSGAVGDFSQNGLRGSTANAAPPVKVNRGYNYHPSVFFVKTANNDAHNRLQSAGTYSNTAAENVTTVFVLKRDMKYTDDGLLSLNNASGAGDNGDIGWNYNNAYSGRIAYYWNGGNRFPDNNTYFANEGLITIDNANNSNTTTGGVNLYLNGSQLGTTQSSGGSTAYNNSSRVVLGGSWQQYAAEYGYEGDIQEVIIFKA
ncbi:MAG: hypothetical protein LBN23_03120, partial [Paludibacter sp.]|nr:hypothetical protein [Paludibacter sp.]